MDRGVKGLARQRTGDRMILLMAPLSSFESVGKNTADKVEEAPSGLLAGPGRHNRCDFSSPRGSTTNIKWPGRLLQHHQLVSLQSLPPHRVECTFLPIHIRYMRGTRGHRGGGAK